MEKQTCKNNSEEKKIDTRLEEETKEVDIQSFIDAKESTEQKRGFARLKKAEVVESFENKNKKFRHFKYNYEDEQCLVFESEMASYDSSDDEDDIVVVVPYYSHLDDVLNWTGSDDVSDLANTQIPVEHIRDDVYKMKVYPDYFPTKIQKKLIDSNFINYSGQKWSKSLRSKKLLNRGSIVLFSSLIFLFSNPLVLTSLFSLLVTVTSLSVLAYFTYRLFQIL